jgi:hypothetical protein
MLVASESIGVTRRKKKKIVRFWRSHPTHGEMGEGETEERRGCVMRRRAPKKEESRPLLFTTRLSRWRRVLQGGLAVPGASANCAPPAWPGWCGASDGGGKLREGKLMWQSMRLEIHTPHNTRRPRQDRGPSNLLDHNPPKISVERQSSRHNEWTRFLLAVARFRPVTQQVGGSRNNPQASSASLGISRRDL